MTGAGMSLNVATAARNLPDADAVLVLGSYLTGSKDMQAWLVERDVLDSLPNILPPADWEAVAGYFISRSLEHGTRRAEEMAEAAATVAEAGLEPVMARATVTRQHWAAQYPTARHAGSTVAVLDAVLREVFP